MSKSFDFTSNLQNGLNGFVHNGVSPHQNSNHDDRDCISNVMNQESESTALTERVEELLKLGNYEEALNLLSALLDNKSNDGVLQTKLFRTLNESEEAALLERRCLIRMKKETYDKVIMDAERLLQLDPKNSIGYKCFIAALCKIKKLTQVNDILKRWQKHNATDVEMIECKNKITNLITAVKTGIDAADAFCQLETLLRLNYEWLLGRNIADIKSRFRPLPPGVKTFNLCLQYRFGKYCPLGEKCSEAHGKDELEEWQRQIDIQEAEMRMIQLSLTNEAKYLEANKKKLSAPDGRNSLIFEDTNNVKIKFNTQLDEKIPLSSSGKERAHFWKFMLSVKIRLHYVALLEDNDRSQFYLGKCYFHGNNGKELLNPDRCKSGHDVLDCTSLIPGEAKLHIYSVNVGFKSSSTYGKFKQTIIFDFGNDIKFARNVSVEVVPPSDDDEAEEDDLIGCFMSNSFSKTKHAWNHGNATILDSATGGKVPLEKLGFAVLGEKKALKEHKILDKDNFKSHMRSFLTEEERARQEILSKYNVTAVLSVSTKLQTVGGISDGTVRYALKGELFGSMSLFRDISEDTAVGRLILRSCSHVLMTKSELAKTYDKNSSKEKPVVYLCSIVEKAKNAVHICLGPACVEQLGIQSDSQYSFDIQFQLERNAFIEQKQCIERLSEFHLDMLFPSMLKEPQFFWTPIKHWGLDSQVSNCKLNPRQKQALLAITEDSVTLPVLVIGPFGTGKTYTLAQCIRRIIQNPNTRVMVCTHSNSAADLYIKDYLDAWCSVDPAYKPLRVYYSKRSLSSVHFSVWKYCLIQNGFFRPPTKEEILSHRVIVVTLTTSYELIDLDLPEDTFSHILLDEAAQAMESEAVVSFLLAGPKTKIVLAGDHMQLSPELFSDEGKFMYSSLLERLHYSYDDNHPCKLMLCENYRSHASIIEYASDNFYTRKLECGKQQPVHSKYFPLTFFATKGEDVQDPDSTSYYNMSEVYEVCEKVCELISSWPEKWGEVRSESSIGVLTPYADQVAKIRARLRAKRLQWVSVERVFNVQGKQFRAVILSTVRTHKPWVRILPETVREEVDLGFFSNPKLLNTALTRAQSLVAVVGDPVSLCSVGKCRRLWEEFIKICHDNNSLHGISYSKMKESLLGVEMRLHWGLNPLASSFVPKNQELQGNNNGVVTSMQSQQFRALNMSPQKSPAGQMQMSVSSSVSNASSHPRIFSTLNNPVMPNKNCISPLNSTPPSSNDRVTNFDGNKNGMMPLTNHFMMDPRSWNAMMNPTVLQHQQQMNMIPNPVPPICSLPQYRAQHIVPGQQYPNWFVPGMNTHFPTNPLPSPMPFHQNNFPGVAYSEQGNQAGCMFQNQPMNQLYHSSVRAPQSPVMPSNMRSYGSHIAQNSYQSPPLIDPLSHRLLEVKPTPPSLNGIQQPFLRHVNHLMYRMDNPIVANANQNFPNIQQRSNHSILGMHPAEAIPPQNQQAGFMFSSSVPTHSMMGNSSVSSQGPGDHFIPIHHNNGAGNAEKSIRMSSSYPLTSKGLLTGEKGFMSISENSKVDDALFHQDRKTTQVVVGGNILAQLTNPPPAVKETRGFTGLKNFYSNEDYGAEGRSYANVVKQANPSAAVGFGLSNSSSYPHPPNSNSGSGYSPQCFQ